MSEQDEDNTEHNRNLSSVVSRGFKEVGKQIAELKGETKSEIASLESKIGELRVQLKPIMAAFDFGKDNINERLIRLEEQVKRIDGDVSGAKTRGIGLIIAVLGALATAVWSLISSHIGIK